MKMVSPFTEVLKIRSFLKHLCSVTVSSLFWISYQIHSFFWTNLKLGWFKINCNGAWCVFEREKGIGWVARDYDGVVLGVSVKFLEDGGFALMMECLAIWRAVCWDASLMC